MPDTSKEIEQWMAKTRLRLSGKLLDEKLEKAEKRGFKSIMLPVESARSLSKLLHGE
jgi:hypothetical protein